MNDWRSDDDFFKQMKGIRKAQNVSLAVGIIVVLAIVGTGIWGVITLITWLTAS